MGHYTRVMRRLVEMRDQTRDEARDGRPASRPPKAILERLAMLRAELLKRKDRKA